MYSRTGISLALITLILALCTGCGKQPAQNQELSRNHFVMDTIVTITLHTPDPQLGEKALDAAFAEFSRIDKLADRFAEPGSPAAEESDVCRINQNAGLAPLTVEKDILTMLEKCHYFSELSEGAFDATIGPVMDLWGFMDAVQRVPEKQALNDALTLVDYRLVMTDREQKTVFLPRDKMKIDLGGIAKGYATDLAAEELRRLGITSAIINAGGNVYALGAKPDGSPWRVGIQDPRDSEKIIAVLNVTDTSVVSSGDYKRYFTVDGIRYHHIIDPSTGEPAGKMTSVTVVAANSADADVLSTALFVTGPERGAELIRELPGVQAVFVDNEQNILFSQSLEGRIEFLEPENHPLSMED